MVSPVGRSWSVRCKLQWYAIRLSWLESHQWSHQEDILDYSTQVKMGGITSASVKEHNQSKMSSCMHWPRTDQRKILFMPTQENVAWKNTFYYRSVHTCLGIHDYHEWSCCNIKQKHSVKSHCRAKNATNSIGSLTKDSQCHETHRIQTNKKPWYHV